jgi:hypothetical protein
MRLLMDYPSVTIFGGIMEMTREQMAAEIERLRVESAALKLAMGKKISYRISEKGAISFYGFGRFPLTIYAKNLCTLFSMQKELENFMQVNVDKLVWEKVKADL